MAALREVWNLVAVSPVHAAPMKVSLIAKPRFCFTPAIGAWMDEARSVRIVLVVEDLYPCVRARLVRAAVPWADVMLDSTITLGEVDRVWMYRIGVFPLAGAATDGEIDAALSACAGGTNTRRGESEAVARALALERLVGSDLDPWECASCGDWELPRLFADEAYRAYLRRRGLCCRCACWNESLSLPGEVRADGRRVWRAEVYLGELACEDTTQVLLSRIIPARTAMPPKNSHSEPRPVGRPKGSGRGWSLSAKAAAKVRYEARVAAGWEPFGRAPALVAAPVATSVDACQEHDDPRDQTAEVIAHGEDPPFGWLFG